MGPRGIGIQSCFKTEIKIESGFLIQKSLKFLIFYKEDVQLPSTLFRRWARLISDEKNRDAIFFLIGNPAHFQESVFGTSL